ncbi:MAG TPA: hypothetical protein VM285_03195 [Polyangia bacterium]|nr:hypothetical protein [Polyangia bacterium]
MIQLISSRELGRLRYQREKSPGEYLVCVGQDTQAACAGVTIGDSDVVSVHVKYLNAPPEIIVFYPGQTDPDTDRVFVVDMP